MLAVDSSEKEFDLLLLRAVTIGAAAVAGITPQANTADLRSFPIDELLLIILLSVASLCFNYYFN